MSISINLLSKKRKNTGSKGIFSFFYIAVMTVFVLYFLGTSAFVVYNLFQLNQSLTRINQEAVALSQDIRAKNDEVTKYVLSKGILDYYANLQTSKFHYKEYMDQIVTLISADAVLKNVDFSLKGVVSISLEVSNYASLELFEQKFSDDSVFSGTRFDSVFVESLSRDKKGKYIIKMQFSIKKNA